MSFQGLETMAQIAFIMLEGADKVLMATRHPSAGPLDIGVEPSENPFLQLRQTHDRHTPPLSRICRLRRPERLRPGLACSRGRQLKEQ